MTQTVTPTDSRLEALRAAFPEEALFAGKEWLFSPQPLVLEKRLVREIADIGRRLGSFVRACNLIYQRSVKGSLPSWIHETLDAGKPPTLVDYSRRPELREALPRVLRPDLLLGEGGFGMSELDNVPGGIGLTAWLNATYAGLGEENLLGGEDGMLRGFQSILPDGGDIVVSDESADYRPELSWLSKQLNERQAAGTSGSDAANYSVHRAEDYEPRGRDIYRFFELFDLENIPFARDWAERGKFGEAAGVDISPPLKPYLEEKLWMAIFWNAPLREVWRRELRDSGWRRLRETIPFSWVADPAPLPPHGVLPRTELNQFSEVARLSQKERDLVLKISGFSEKAWGSRGVHIGSDLPQAEWENVVSEALASFDTNPYVLQQFQKTRIIEHPYWDRESGKLVQMKGRARLCPYFFVPKSGGEGGKAPEPELGGVLATIVPADKKILHGMSDAIMVPCAVEGSQELP